MAAGILRSTLTSKSSATASSPNSAPGCENVHRRDGHHQQFRQQHGRTGQRLVHPAHDEPGQQLGGRVGPRFGVGCPRHGAHGVRHGVDDQQSAGHPQQPLDRESDAGRDERQSVGGFRQLRVSAHARGRPPAGRPVLHALRARVAWGRNAAGLHLVTDERAVYSQK